MTFDPDRFIVKGSRLLQQFCDGLRKRKEEDLFFKKTYKQKKQNTTAPSVNVVTKDQVENAAICCRSYFPCHSQHVQTAASKT